MTSTYGHSEIFFYRIDNQMSDCSMVENKSISSEIKTYRGHQKQLTEQHLASGKSPLSIFLFGYGIQVKS